MGQAEWWKPLVFAGVILGVLIAAVLLSDANNVNAAQSDDLSRGEQIQLMMECASDANDEELYQYVKGTNHKTVTAILAAAFFEYRTRR